MSEFSDQQWDEDVEVLIVGGSVVGLSMALFLARHGITALLVERHATTSMHTRAGSFNACTMELFRQVDRGLEVAIFEQAAPPEQLGEMGLRVESLTGRILDDGEVETRQWANIVSPFMSPTRSVMIGQDRLEPILREWAEGLGSAVRFGTEMVSFEQDDEGINALMRERESGREYRVHARYLVAADGNRSGIRQQLGIDTYGYGTLGRWVSILFQTDLSDVLVNRKVSLCFVSNTSVDGIMGQAGVAGDRWWLFANVRPRTGERPDAPSDAYCLDLIHAAIGIPDQPVTITSTLPWELAIRVAERYQEGCVFLVGDAAHVMTTMGAFGANTGIADAHNLAWKLALVLKGKAGEHLLESYGRERQAVANLAVGVSSGLYAYRLSYQEQKKAIIHSAEEMLGRVRASADSPQPTSFSVVDGYRYRSDAVAVWHDDDGMLYENEPSGRVGTRAPHVWLRHNGEQVSMLDLYGGSFVLLVGPNGEWWKELWEKAANKIELPIAKYCIGQGQRYEDGGFLASYGIGDAGAVLVRPDGFVAWRAPNGATQGVGVDDLFVVLSRLLGNGAG